MLKNKYTIITIYTSLYKKTTTKNIIYKNKNFEDIDKCYFISSPSLLHVLHFYANRVTALHVMQQREKLHCLKCRF